MKEGTRHVRVGKSVRGEQAWMWEWVQACSRVSAEARSHPACLWLKSIVGSSQGNLAPILYFFLNMYV